MTVVELKNQSVPQTEKEFQVEVPTLGDSLREIRKAKGYTLQQVADALSINRSYLSQIENDCYNPSFRYVEKLVSFYGYVIALVHRSNPIVPR